MIITIRRTLGSKTVVGLASPDDFTAFTVSRASNLSSEEFTGALTQVGRQEGVSHAYVSVYALKRLAGERATKREWLAGLDGMITYAHAKGRVDDLGFVQARIQ